MSYLTRQEAASLLKISIKTLDRWVNSGYLKPIKIAETIKGRTIMRFTEDDLFTSANMEFEGNVRRRKRLIC